METLWGVHITYMTCTGAGDRTSVHAHTVRDLTKDAADALCQTIYTATSGERTLAVRALPFNTGMPIPKT